MVSQNTARNRVNDTIDRLAHEYRGTFSAETIRALVTNSFESYRGSRIADFVPLLAYKSARDQLGALVRAGRSSGLPD
jgi:hypothetical protein